MANSYKSVGAVSTTSLTTIYTCPASTTAYIMLARATNVSNGSDPLDFVWFDASTGAAFHITDDLIIPPKGSVRLLEDRLVLEAGDTIQISTTTAGTVHVVLSVMEVA